MDSSSQPLILQGKIHCRFQIVFAVILVLVSPVYCSACLGISLVRLSWASLGGWSQVGLLVFLFLD